MDLSSCLSEVGQSHDWGKSKAGQSYAWGEVKNNIL